MKKLALGLLTAFSLSHADILSFGAGAGFWQENIGGYVKNGDKINYFNNKSAEDDGDDNTGNLGLHNTVKPFIWAKIIHPLPFVPNVRLQYTRFDTSGDGVAVGSTKLFGVVEVSGSANVHTTLAMNSYDATFFYELKPVFADFEAGFGVNVLQGYSKVENKDNGDTTEGNWVTPLPYLYARVETTPIFGISFETSARYLDVSAGHYYDYRGAVKYHLPLPILDVTTSVGYRYQDTFAKDGDDETNLRYNGAFAQVGVKW